MKMWQFRLQLVRSGKGASVVLPLFLALLVAAHLLFVITPAQAQESGNRAGLVVVYPDGRVTSRCVSFEEPAISGLALLQRSTLPFATASGPMGVQLCSVNGEGCPATDCWCECRGAPCAYWNYYHGNPDGSWAYANLGAASRSISHGDVDAWLWGDGSRVPPTMSFSSICADNGVGVAPPPAIVDVEPAETPLPPTPTAPATVAATPTELSPTVAPARTVVPTPSVVPTRTAIAAPTSTGTPDAEAENSGTPIPDTLTPSPLPTATPVPTVSPTSPPAATVVPPTATAFVEGSTETGPSDETGGTREYLAFVAVLTVLGGVFMFLRHRQGG